MPNLQDALAYVNAGINILPLFPIRNGTCACNGLPGCAPGKHPIGKLAPNGVYSASHDEATITHWWTDWPDANIGIALGALNNGLYAQDIDNSPMATKLLDILTDPEADLGFVVAKSGRINGGCHIYLRMEDDQNTENLYSTDGEKIGELRGTGSLTVAPPSVHASGAVYAFVKGDLVQKLPNVVPNARMAILGLLRAIGVAVGAKKKGQTAPIGAISPIESVDCPVPLEGAPTLAQMVSGLYPIKDRSVDLFHYALEILRQAKRKGLDIGLDQVAGAVKQFDASLGRPKYANRNDADIHYWLKATQAKQKLDEEGIAPPPKETIRSDGDEIHYYEYDEHQGLFFLGGQNRDRLIRMANFKPELVCVTTIIKDKDEDPDSEYTLRASRHDEEIEIKLTNKDIRSDYLFRAALTTKLPYQYLLEPGDCLRVWLAANELSPHVEHNVTYGRMGWIEHDETKEEEKNTYILPGMEGAITADGIDPSIRFAGKIDPWRFSLYGKNVRPIETNDDRARALNAFKLMLDLDSPDNIVPILSQIMAGPLTSFGMSDSPPFIHYHGITGQLKSSIALTMLCMFGQFIKVAGNIDTSMFQETWSSTPASLSITMYTLRDVTMIFDDYKISHMKQKDAGGVVQNYSDRTTRSRAASDQTRRKSLIPAGLVLSTGEELWSEEESVEARTLVLPVRHLKGDALEERKARLLEFERCAAHGDLGLIGGTYIRYLARQGGAQLSQTIADTRATGRTKMGLQIHARTVSIVATLRTAEVIVSRFIKEEFPELDEQFQAMRTENWTVMRRRLLDDAEAAKQLAPLRQVLNTLIEQLEAGKVRLAAWRTNNFYAGAGSLAGEVVGFYDEGNLYLTKGVTMNWYKTLMVREGSPASFSWNAVKKDGRETCDARDDQLTFPGFGRSIALIIPLKSIPFMEQYLTR